MIWHWVTCFSVVLAVANPASGEGPRGAAVKGSVALTGSRESRVQKEHDFSGVVVWLEPLVGMPAAPDSISRRLKPVAMLQKHKMFVPHLIAIPVGTAVAFPNADPIFHNVFSSFSGQVFDIGLYPPGTSRSVVFKRPGVVRVFCNIHPAMSAIILVMRSRYFATTDTQGNFTITDVPPGDYLLQVFHERASEETLEKLQRGVSVTDAETAIPPLSISESGYLALPHKNKYGKDYPPAGYIGATP